ncbi:MAG: Lrp/AsnC family transcriptional regulator [Gammaproteobacteria bacterium]|nr:Lrp/AsnC family transcriptional regulator [Gammaproteobacteria bacterium]
MTFDRIDARILQHLSEDGRRSVVELAEKVGLSETPCARRVRLLEQAGVIRGYRAVLDPARLGLNVRAFVQVKLERHTDENIDQFRRELSDIEEVISCHATTGTYDFLLHVVAPDLESFSRVVLKRLMKIFYVRDVHSSIVLETLKETARLPLGQLAAREAPPR